MKASELITKLQENINTYGDYDVVYDNYYIYDIDGIEVITDKEEMKRLGYIRPSFRLW